MGVNLDGSIDQLMLSVRTWNVLRRMQIDTVRQAALLVRPGWEGGKKSWLELEDVLTGIGVYAMMALEPVEIKYRDGKQQIVTIMADACSGEIPAHSDTYYCLFYLGYEEGPHGRRQKQVARVAKSRLVKGYYEVYQKLFGRPWLKRYLALPERITLSDYPYWEQELNVPDDTDYVYRINHESDMCVYIAGCKESARAVLHIMNNEDVTVYNIDRYQAIKALFPGKKVTLMEPTVRAVEL